MECCRRGVRKTNPWSVTRGGGDIALPTLLLLTLFCYLSGTRAGVCFWCRDGVGQFVVAPGSSSDQCIGVKIQFYLTGEFYLTAGVYCYRI